MIESSTRPALPAVGPLLGAAYGRAVTVVVRSWRAVAILLATVVAFGSLLGIHFTYNVGSSFSNIPLLIWSFIAMANAIRAVFDPDYKMNKYRVSDMLAAGLVSGILISAVNFLGIYAYITRTNVVLWLLAVPGLATGIWLAVKWLSAQALAARGTSPMMALTESFRLTSTAFWPALAIICVTWTASTVIPYGIDLLWTNLSRFFAPPGPAFALAIGATALRFCASAYAEQAAQLSICMWLKALEEAQPVGPTPA